jgi:hypothetical protein
MSRDVRAGGAACRRPAARLATRASQLVVGATLLTGCPDPAGNDPNVPDLVPDGTILKLASAATCPPATPSACPQTPSYKKDVQPLVARACVPCHSPGGVAADRDLTTYEGFVRLETTNFVQIESCVMPPADAGPDAALSLHDRTEILQWFVCGSPDN